MFLATPRRVARYYSRLKRALPLALADVLILLAAYLITYWVRGQSFSPFFGANGDVFLLATAALMLLTLFAYGAYDRIWAKRAATTCRSSSTPCC